MAKKLRTSRDKVASIAHLATDKSSRGVVGQVVQPQRVVDIFKRIVGGQTIGKGHLILRAIRVKGCGRGQHAAARHAKGRAIGILHTPYRPRLGVGRDEVGGG